MPKDHKLAKRLAKSVKRRRTFAEQLRIESNAVRAAAHTMGVAEGRIEEAFARRLDAIASREFGLAHQEHQEQLAASERHASTVPQRPADPDRDRREANAIAALSESGSAARVRYMADHFGVARGENPGTSRLLGMIEELLDTEKLDTPEAREGLLFGQRIVRAETLLFTKPRF